MQSELGVNGSGVAYGDLRRFHSRSFSLAEKLDLVSRITSDNGRDFAVSPSVGLVAVTIGNFGAGISLHERVAGTITGEAAALTLLGNVARAPGATYPGTRSQVQGWSGATLSLSYGFRLPVDALMPGALSAGVTLKVNRAISAVSALDFERASPGGLPTVGWVALMNDKATLSTGSGWAFDFGFAYHLASGIRVAVSIENILSDVIAWNESHLVYYRRDYRQGAGGAFLMDSTLTTVDHASLPLVPDPMLRVARDSLQRMGRLPKRLELGVSRAAERWTVQAGLAISVTGGGTQPAGGGAGIQLNLPSEARIRTETIGAGLEWRLPKFLALRGGVFTDGQGAFSFGAGFGISAAGVRIDFSAAATPSQSQASNYLAAGVSFFP